jgi:hypothetical protein
VVFVAAALLILFRLAFLNPGDQPVGGGLAGLHSEAERLNDLAAKQGLCEAGAAILALLGAALAVWTRVRRRRLERGSS